MNGPSLRALLFSAALVAAPLQASATGVPVFDASNVAKAIEQVKALSDQLKEMEAQTKRLQENLDAIRGARGMSALLNSVEQQGDRAFASAPIAEIEQLFGKGGALSGEAGKLSSRIEALKGEFKLMPGAALTPDQPGSLVAKRHDFSQGTTLAALALSAEAFDRAPDRIEVIEVLIGAIDAAPDLKASVDLTNRIAAENALLLAQLIQLQATQLRLAGASAHAENAARDEGARRALSASRADFKSLFD